jgi:methyl-accepting chemotaxis protein
MSMPARLPLFRAACARLPSIKGLATRMRIATRLALAFSALLLLSAGLGAFAIWQLGVVKQASDEITDKWMAGVRLSSQMNTDASDFRIAEAKHILAADDTERQKYDGELKAVAEVLQKHTADYEQLVSSPDEKKLFDGFRRERQRYLDEHARMMRLSGAGQAEDAKALLTYNSQKKYEGASAALRRLVDYNIAGAQQASRTSDRTYALARQWIVTVLLATVALGAALSWAIARSISRPLRQAVGVAGAVAEGDLGVRVPAGGRDETGQLLQALQVMTGSLNKLVGEVHLGSEQVAISSREIASGNADLSRRTEQQAAQLQQVAASMTQLQAAVKSIDEAASHATRLAGGAAHLAQMGAAVMERMVENMHHITGASKRIGDITGLIDAIAFKTNILALNAAVEAARAGEAGRSFGVVASEVRALAHSSAEAARDIKGLIEQSKETVSAGSSLVGEVGGAMSEISAQVASVSQLIGRISTATNDQAADISQVCEAIARLDGATQRNAALVEQSAAASESLREQARNLVAATAVFRTQQG